MKIRQKRPHKKFIEQKAYINSNKNIEITKKNNNKEMELVMNVGRIQGMKR
jgi:hypothetical protein